MPMENWSEVVQTAPDTYYPPLEIDEEEESIIAESTTSDAELSAALDERQKQIEEQRAEAHESQKKQADKMLEVSRNK